MKSCSTCGRPPESSCEPCLAGNPPPERVADLATGRAAAADPHTLRQLQDVRRNLADIPNLVVEVSHYVVPGSAPTDPNGHPGTSIPSHKLVIDPAVADLLDTREKDMEPDDIVINRADGHRRLGVIPSINMWCQLVYAELEDIGGPAAPCCPRGNHTLARECAWLATHAEQVLRLHDDFAGEVRSIAADLRNACRITIPYVPTCSVCGNRMEGQYADGEATDRTAAWWKCTACPNTLQHDAEIRRMALTQPPLTLRQISSLLQIPLRTLYNWEAEGRFLPVRRNNRGGKLYEVEHVRRAAAKTRSA